MSMDFSEFKRRLGADPRSRDPDLLRARDASPEFREAAAEAERFEARLERALFLREPPDLLDSLRATTQRQAAGSGGRSWWPMALAAGLLLAVTAAGLNWWDGPRWDSVEDYVIEHYYHDGLKLLADAGSAEPADVQAMFAGFDVQAAPTLADVISVIKYCVTPDGKGIHMVLETGGGLITVIYMPGTPVEDQETFGFDGQQALLVQLQHGSAAIVGTGEQNMADYYALVHDSILPLPGST
jgi:hypothetical protein